MGGKTIGVYMTLVLMCCSAFVVSAASQLSKQQPPVYPTPSYVDALGFLSGRISNLTNGHDDFGDFIEFHANHVLFLAFAPFSGCSIIWLFLNKDVHIHLESPATGYIGIQSLHIVFKTFVAGPI